MNILQELKRRLRVALEPLVRDPHEFVEMLRASQDPRFGDYQANCAMPIGKQLNRPPREIASQIVERLEVADICETPLEIAGPGFINFRLRAEFLAERILAAVRDERLGIGKALEPRGFVVDFSSPNVAKPMHVGHIRSTVIGDALTRVLRFLGNRVISDNHLGDWGTQFGMILYGYKHFVRAESFAAQPVQELTRLYKLVNQLVEYHEAVAQLPPLRQAVSAEESEVARLASQPPTGDKGADKKQAAARRKSEEKLTAARETVAAAQRRIQDVEQNAELARLAAQHATIGDEVLRETARLHAGDTQNRQLWEKFLPLCDEEIQRIYQRLGVEFDFAYGESFYQPRLTAVVDEFTRRGLARDSEGASCIFLPGFDSPMIIRKKDGAFLYATTDLATIQFRMETWHPDVVLYVVDHRQSEHFEKLFAAARLWGFERVELRHISFGTVLGEDGKPYKTRSGETVGLESLLDEAVRRAYEVVKKNDEEKPNGPELSDDERRHVAEVVGHAAIKYADLSHNRTSDYVFSYDKMVSLEGNTATYMQYSYARTQSIFAKGNVDVAALRGGIQSPTLAHPMERALALSLLQFENALDEVLVDYRPNQLTAYLYDVATQFSRFYQQCSVLDAESEGARNTRLLLCDLTGRTIRIGLNLLGIGVVERM